MFEADASRPPITPPGAFALAIRSATGEIIGYAWVHPSYVDDRLFRCVHGWVQSLEEPAPVMPTAFLAYAGSLTLVK